MFDIYSFQFVFKSSYFTAQEGKRYLKYKKMTKKSSTLDSGFVLSIKTCTNFFVLLRNEFSRKYPNMSTYL